MKKLSEMWAPGLMSMPVRLWAYSVIIRGSRGTFKKVVDVAEGVPVLMAGGARAKNLLDFLKVLRDCLDAGCSGAVVGRNVFQSEDPQRAAKAIVRLVHEDLTPEEAVQL